MQPIVTLTQRKAAEAERRAAAVQDLIPVLADYARRHGGRFLLFGSAARNEMTYHSDVDLLLDFPAETLSDAWNFAERACWDRELEPDLLPYDGCKPSFLQHVAAGARKSDASWFDIQASVTAAVRHFGGAVDLFDRLPHINNEKDRYAFEMGFMHAMQSGHTSMEAALLRILGLFKEEAPTGARWHADLIDHVVQPVRNRPPVLKPATAKAANETRQFRRIATHAYDSFDHTKAVRPVESARALITLLPADVGAFRQATDP